LRALTHPKQPPLADVQYARTLHLALHLDAANHQTESGTAL